MAFLDGRLVNPVHVSSRIYSLFFVCFYKTDVYLLLAPSISLLYFSSFYFVCSLYVTNSWGVGGGNVWWCLYCQHFCPDLFCQQYNLQTIVLLMFIEKLKWSLWLFVVQILIQIHSSGFISHSISSVDLVSPCSEFQIRERMQIFKYVCTYIDIHICEEQLFLLGLISLSSVLWLLKLSNRGKISSWESYRKLQTSLYSFFICVHNMKQINLSNVI